MDLEKRVNTLEQEVKILKNQIQKTLLDIQEQVLTNYYPSLRTGNGSGADTSSPRSAHNGRSAEEADDTDALPKVNKVTLDELKGKKTAVESPSSGETADSSSDSFETWVAWVDDSVQKFGLTRTQKLVEIRAGSGSLSAETYEMLQQLLTLYEGQTPPHTSNGHEDNHG